ncbi:MAG: serine/threonine-protein kinase [Nannocystaceae bacterium]
MSGGSTNRVWALELRPHVVVADGRYRVVARAGWGGVATVYRARDLWTGRTVALKVMHAELLGRPARAFRFDREARITRGLPEHPGLVRLLDTGRLPELNGRPFSCLEWIAGPTLAFRLGEDLQLPVSQVVAWGWRLADALAVVHARGVVHRDLNARNVMLRDRDHRGHPVLVDFGMAGRVEPAGTRLTRLHERPGTVTTMSPEQFRGRAPCPAMDVYALGRLLYEMLTAEDPHASVTRSQLLEHHRAGRRVAPVLGQRSGPGPAALRELVDRCLEPAPARRPTAAQLREGLQQVEDGLGAGATVLSFVGRGVGAADAAARGDSVQSAAATTARSQHRRRRRTAWGRAAVVVGLLAVGSGRELVGRPQGAGGPAIPSVRRADRDAAAWPATVVPYATVPAVADRAAVAQADVVPADFAAGFARARPARGDRRSRRPAEAPTDGPPLPSCTTERAAVHDAVRRWAWSEVLRGTEELRCWPAPEERLRMRLTALVELHRFRECAAEGAGVAAPSLSRLVARCRRRADAGSVDPQPMHPPEPTGPAR